MPVLELEQMRSAVRGESRLLGIDLGTRTIGLALSDVRRTVATPAETLPRERFHRTFARLDAFVAEHGVGGIVLGLPLEMDGTEGSRAQGTRQFAANLLEKRDLPLLFWDERLSTAAVERFLIGEADLSRGKRAAVVDRAAAAYILQGALDALARLDPPPT